MTRKLIYLLAFLMTGAVFFTACNNEGETTTETETEATESTASTDDGEVHGERVMPGEVELNTPLNQDWVATGKNIYELKCQSCHKLTEERLVGPGWEGLTDKREPHWIMNMITNVDMMLETDPEAQKLLEECLVRMPNQNVSKDDARKILEFMRHNDGVK